MLRSGWSRRRRHTWGLVIVPALLFVAPLATAQSLSEFAIALNSEPTGITAGADGNLWITLFNRRAIGRMTPNEEIAEFATNGRGRPLATTAAPDGNRRDPGRGRHGAGGVPVPPHAAGARPTVFH